MTEVSPARSYPELFRVTGPLLSLVFRTEDVWQKCNQLIETTGLSIRVSPSHPYNAGRAGFGWMRGWLRRNVYVVYSDCVVSVCVWGGGGGRGGDLARRSGIQG